MRRSHRLLAIAATLAACLVASAASAQNAIGAVSRIQGEAKGTRGNDTRALAVNLPVYSDEVVSTGKGARLEVTLVDRTQLTLGENAKLTLDTYVFDPAAGKGQIHIAVTGAFRYLSGQASKLASADVNVTTPVATIGIRGTEFWGGPIDKRPLSVFLIDGAVSVSNAAGQRILSRRGQGTDIPAAGAAPGPVTIWPAAKVRRAIATVSFR